MKRAFLAAAAASLLIAAPAFAAGTPVSTNVVVSGSVAPQCGVGNQSGGGARSLGPAINLGSITTADGALNNTTTTPIGFDNIWCNEANTLAIDVSSLKLQSPPAAWDDSSFMAAVDMVVSADANDHILPTYFGISTLASVTTSTDTSTSTTDGTASVPLGAVETGTGKFSQALLTLAYPSGHNVGDRPLAGSWQGTVTVTATPN